MESKLFKLKKDIFREARGGYARFLHLYCAGCNHLLFLYQKDGPGPLKRLYADRIIAPEDFSRKPIEIGEAPTKIHCFGCSLEIATAYLYEKEKRIAFLVKQGSLAKKLGKGTFPPQTQTSSNAY